jgi:predicted CXXCH cytochrome family protein
MMWFVQPVIAGIVLLFSSPSIAFDPAGQVPANAASRYCEACHDGVIASATRLTHPIGVDYLLSQFKSRGKLRDISQLSRDIRLDDGRVGCLSCHSADSQNQAKLVTSNAGSGLCFACHNL